MLWQPSLEAVMARWRIHSCLLGITICWACNQPSAPTPPGDVKPASSTTSTRVVTAIRGEVFDVVGRGIAGATVRIVDGPETGTSATSDATGNFSIAGTFTRDVTLSASLDGYVTRTQSLILANFTGTTGLVDFSLASAAPSAHFDAGTYDVTFVPDPACTGLPDDQRTLSFVATLGPAPNEPHDSYYFVDIPNTIGFGLASFGGTLKIDIDMPISRFVPPNIQVGFTAFGQATVPTLTPSTATFSVSGAYDYCAFTGASPEWTNCDLRPADTITKHVKCISQNHQLVLARQ
jgi:hypothetical protein